MAAARYDIVGCGSVVRQHHVPPLQLLRSRGEVEIAGCYDLNQEAAGGLAELLGADRSGLPVSPRSDDGVDAVLIATPPTTHAEVALDYIRAGKDVFVEKPFTATAGEAATLVAEAEAGGTRIIVDHFRRYLPNANLARRFLQGRLDEVRSVEASDGQRWDWAAASDYLVEDPYGGVIHDSGSHLLDTVLYMLGLDGDGEAVSAEITRLEKTPEQEPSHECRATIALKRPRGERISLSLSVSRLRPLAAGVKVSGSFGLLLVPFTFGGIPILLRDSSGFRLDSVEVGTESDDPKGCFLLAHHEFRAALGDPGAKSRIDGRRFLLLAGLLESLHEGGRG